MSGAPRTPRFPLSLERMTSAMPAKATKAPSTQTARVPAAADPAAGVPSGLGLDSHGVRVRMVARLRGAGARHDGVLAAMVQLPRHFFVDTALAAQAYEDTSLPIGHGQTISKPSIVARMSVRSSALSVIASVRSFASTSIRTTAS